MIISEFCKRNAEQIEEKRDKVDENDMEIFRRLKAGKASLAEIHGSIKTLTRIMSFIYNRKVIVIIELKRSSKKEDMEADCKKALGQIVEKGYALTKP